MKIIFLDIDGVLNVYCEGRDEYGCTFHKHFENNLKWIIEETGAKIVITSTWRYSGLNIMQEMWKKRELTGEVIGVTPNHSSIYYEEPNYKNLPFQERLERGFEIQEWLDKHKVDSYVILDDDNDMLTSQLDNFIQTSNNSDHEDCIDMGYGLTHVNVQKKQLKF